MENQPQPADFELSYLRALEKLSEIYKRGEALRLDEKTFGELTGISDPVMASRVFDYLTPTVIVYSPARDGRTKTMHDIPEPDYVINGPNLLGRYRAELQRRRDEQERLQRQALPPDRVEAAKRWARSHPAVSLLVIALLVYGMVATIINQSIELFDRLGWLK
jgi:hypothetical protein